MSERFVIERKTADSSGLVNFYTLSDKTKEEYIEEITEEIYQQTVEQNQSYVLRPDVKCQKDFLEAIKKQCKIYAKAVADKLFQGSDNGK